MFDFIQPQTLSLQKLSEGLSCIISNPGLAAVGQGECEGGAVADPLHGVIISKYLFKIPF